MRHATRLNVNGEARELALEPMQTLLDVLTEDFRLSRTKEGCGIGECGACTVYMDGKLVSSCLVLAMDADGKEIVTFSDTRDLIEKIRYYLAHDDERAAIAQAGYEHTLREHTYQKRFQEIFRQMKLTN